MLWRRPSVSRRGNRMRPGEAPGEHGGGTGKHKARGANKTKTKISGGGQCSVRLARVVRSNCRGPRRRYLPDNAACLRAGRRAAGAGGGREEARPSRRGPVVQCLGPRFDSRPRRSVASSAPSFCFPGPFSRLRHSAFESAPMRPGVGAHALQPSARLAPRALVGVKGRIPLY